LLDKLAAQNDADHPNFVMIDGPGDESVYFGVGGHVSFVSSMEMPYLTTVGEEAASGEVNYKFQGHHSPIGRKSTIPAHLARAIVRVFFSTGSLPSWQSWEPT
jgi:hypothetical protein